MIFLEYPNVNEGLTAVIEDVIQDGLLRLSEDECVASPVRLVGSFQPLTDCDRGLYLTSSVSRSTETPERPIK